MTEQDEIFRDIQKVLAGHSERAVTYALLTSLIVAIGVGSESLSRAIAVIDALPTEMKPILRDKWGGFREHRARAELHTSMGHGAKH